MVELRPVEGESTSCIKQEGPPSLLQSAPAEGCCTPPPWTPTPKSSQHTEQRATHLVCENHTLSLSRQPSTSGHRRLRLHLVVIRHENLLLLDRLRARLLGRLGEILGGRGHVSFGSLGGRRVGGGHG